MYLFSGFITLIVFMLQRKGKEKEEDCYILGAILGISLLEEFCMGFELKIISLFVKLISKNQ